MSRLNSKQSTILLIRSQLYFLLLISSFSLLASEPIKVKSGKYQTALLELYTSEGCSSCPPADRWFNQLVKAPGTGLDVLALAFHVDYWDYIGWKDIYADPTFTNRQRHLARVNRQSSVYTPEFFLNGAESRGTARVIAKIQSINNILSTVNLELILQPHKHKIELHLNSQFDAKINPLVQFVVFENNLSSDIKSGENSGRKLNHQQVVRYLSPEQVLTSEISETINIQPKWKQQNLGVGAIVKSKNGDYLQSVFSPFNANFK